MSFQEPHFAATPIVTLYVGEAKIAFYVHEGLLREYSGFFSIALNTLDDAAGAPRVIDLPSDSKEAMQDFIYWLYTHALDCTTTKYSTPDKPQDLVQLYVVADQKDVLELKKDILEKLRYVLQIRLEDNHEIRNLPAAALAYEKLADEEDGVRRLLVSFYAKAVKTGLLDLESEAVMNQVRQTPAFAADLGAALGKIGFRVLSLRLGV